MDFEWDEKKRKENLRKHGLDFRDAPILFEGPMLVHLDTRAEYEESRWIGIGIIETDSAVVAFTERYNGKTTQIISLRKALIHERKIFEKTIKARLA